MTDHSPKATLVVVDETTSNSDTANTPSTLSSTELDSLSDGHSKHRDPAKWVKTKTRVAKTKTKKLLRIDNTKHQVQDDDSGIAAQIEDDPGFNPDATLNAESSTLGQLKDQLPDNAHELKDIIKHPQNATQGKVERTLATS